MIGECERLVVSFVVLQNSEIFPCAQTRYVCAHVCPSYELRLIARYPPTSLVAHRAFFRGRETERLLRNLSISQTPAHQIHPFVPFSFRGGLPGACIFMNMPSS